MCFLFTLFFLGTDAQPVREEIAGGGICGMKQICESRTNAFSFFSYSGREKCVVKVMCFRFTLFCLHAHAQPVNEVDQSEHS